MSLLEDREKAAARKLKRETAAIEAAKSERKEQMRLRRLDTAIKVKQRDILGETIRDAKLTPAQLALIGELLLQRKEQAKDWEKEKPKDWEVIADWLPADTASSVEALSHEPVEFVPTRPKSERLDQIAK